MTAEQARALMNEKKIGFEDIMAQIEIMARNGKNFYFSEKKLILNADHMANLFRAQGYTVTISENYFEINW